MDFKKQGTIMCWRYEAANKCDRLCILIAIGNILFVRKLSTVIQGFQH